MAAQPRPQSADSLIGALADVQHGVVGRWQLIARGVSRHEIAARIADGRLRLIHRGVYLVGDVATAPLAYEAAAILAFRGKATISHRSAAKLLGLLPWPSTAACWVTTPRGDSDRPSLIVRKATLEPCDITSVERIEVTTAARTILDCAAVLPSEEDYRLEGMCAQAIPKLAKPSDLWEQIERNPGKPGVPRLRSVLGRHSPKKPKSELERELLMLIRRSDLPEPEVNAFVLGKERDLVWREQKLVVEADSYTFHSDARTWARDIRKTNELQLAGFVVLRFTWFDVTERPLWAVEEIRRALAAHEA